MGSDTCGIAITLGSCMKTVLSGRTNLNKPVLERKMVAP